MKVKQVMKKQVYTIKPEASLVEAVGLLIKHQISGLIVINGDGLVTGVLSEKDIYRSLYPSYEDFHESPESFLDFEKQEKEIQGKFNKKVKDVMTAQVVSVSPDDYVMKVGAIMLARGINRLPVVNKTGELIGIVTRSMIYQALFKKYLK